MPFQPVILWTDALIFLLLALVIAFILIARRREHLRAPWREVMRSKMAMGCLVVLLAYFTLGLLDSLHFRPALPSADASNGRVDYSTEVLSVLDLAAAPLRSRVEKTYSAPFAAYSYARETVTRLDGTQVREFPRLQFGGAHLQDPAAERGRDILLRSLRALLVGGIIWLLSGALLVALLARRANTPFRLMLANIMRGRTAIPWHVMLYTSGAMMLLAAWCVALSGAYHILGTGKVGQDVFYEAIKSIRTGLVIGTLTTLVTLPFAMLGVLAGYFRGWVDDVVQYVYTTLNSIPDVLLIAAAILMLQVYMANHPDQFDTIALRADVRLLFLCLILGITSWTGLARLLRGETLKLREMDYVQAAVALGAGHAAIIRRHLIPNVMHIVLITMVLSFSGLVLAEAVLSYVGVGVDPSTMSWGNMINSARLEMAREPMVWWLLLAAFVFMFTLVLAANLFSDKVRDAFDPRLRKL
ncbi:MAG: ABC transporter permease [Gammaproteobacteria bacterium]|nr:MAG: ABC transporter permease [Gammaproteobacteria bacterium]